MSKIWQTIIFVALALSHNISAEPYRCSFSVSNFRGQVQSVHEFDGINSLSGAQLDNFEFAVHSNIGPMGKSIQIVISGMGVKLGTDAPMGTPWLIAANETLGVQAGCRLISAAK